MNAYGRRTQAAFLLAVSASLGLWPAKAGAEHRFSVLHNFVGGDDGGSPYGAMILDPSGNLYGTTVYGGDTSECGDLGCGTVFELSPPAAKGGAWTEAVLYRFTGKRDGGYPRASLLRDIAGNLYGTAEAGGSAGGGVAFELSPPHSGQATWSHRVLYAFPSSAGMPVAGLNAGPGGALYGATLTGGSGGNAGTLFSLSPPAAGVTQWAARTIFSFDGRNGSLPAAALVADNAGNLYGTTYSGGSGTEPGYGVVYELTPPSRGAGRWQEHVLWRFKPDADGREPICTLTLDASGNLYGTTSMGGSPPGRGTVFELIRPAAGSVWTENVLFRFPNNGDYGIWPFTGVILDPSGNLYGTTIAAAEGPGVVFRLAPSGGAGEWTETVLQYFSSPTNGGDLRGALVRGADGTLYGTTYSGGSVARGVVFSVAP